MKHGPVLLVLSWDSSETDRILGIPGEWRIGAKCYHCYHGYHGIAFCRLFTLLIIVDIVNVYLVCFCCLIWCDVYLHARQDFLERRVLDNGAPQIWHGYQSWPSKMLSNWQWQDSPSPGYHVSGTATASVTSSTTSISGTLLGSTLRLDGA